MPSVAKKKPCRVCRKWFTPDARVGDRQKVCFEAICQRERHRQACAAWREAERPRVEEERTRQRILTPDGEVDRDAMRDAMGLKVTVVVIELLRLIGLGSRDAFRTKELEIAEESIRLRPHGRRDATDVRGPAP